MATGQDPETVSDAHADQQGDVPGHDDHGHGHDDHGHGHDDHGAHGPVGDAWVLPPIVIGLVIGAILVVVFGLASGAAPSV